MVVNFLSILLLLVYFLHVCQLSQVPFTAHHIMPIILPTTSDRSQVMCSMRDSGIQTSIHYPPFSSFMAYSNYIEDVSLPISDEICQRELTLPLHPRMSLRDVDFVVSKLLEFI